MDAILKYFIDDPLRIFYVIGGTGGLWFWVTTWRGRIRVSIRSITHQYNPKEEPNAEVLLQFEIENLGDTSTSIEPEILVSGYDKDRNIWTESLKIQDSDRKLEPHTPRTIVASGRFGADYIFWIFRTYRFRLTKGRDKKIRFRTQPNNEALPFWKFDFELTLFRRLGWLPFFD